MSLTDTAPAPERAETTDNDLEWAYLEWEGELDDRPDHCRQETHTPRGRRDSAAPCASGPHTTQWRHATVPSPTALKQPAPTQPYPTKAGGAHDQQRAIIFRY